jgi:Spy/CpxP family protein refolding chaperone
MIGWWKHAHGGHGPGGRHGHHGHGGPHDGPGAGRGCGPDGFEARVEFVPGAEGGPDERRGGRGWGRGWGHGGEEAFASHDRHERHDGEGHFGGFGVRRPLRFLAYKLELEEAQVEDLASILNDLKTERAQGDVDHRRSTAAIAEAIASEALDEAKLAAATEDRVKSAERLRDAVVKAIGRIHKMLTAEQRSRFAYLIRTGALSI